MDKTIVTRVKVESNNKTVINFNSVEIRIYNLPLKAIFTEVNICYNQFFFLLSTRCGQLKNRTGHV